MLVTHLAINKQVSIYSIILDVYWGFMSKKEPDPDRGPGSIEN
jgi:hypothetical protein